MAVYKSKDKTKDGRSWYFRIYMKDIIGERKQYSSPKYFTKKDAQEEERLFISKSEYSIKEKFTTIAENYFSELKDKRKESTVYCNYKIYNVNIAPYFENFNSIEEIEIRHIKYWMDSISKKGYKYSYKSKLYILLNSIFKYAMANYGLKNNIVQIIGNFENNDDKAIEDKDKLRYITYEDFNILIDNIDNLMWKTFFIFLFLTGCRKGEVQALTWKDIDFNNNYISIYKTLSVKTSDHYKITNTKNKVNRKIQMSKKLKESLIEYKKEIIKYTDFNDDWFVFGNTRFLPQTTIDREKHKYFEIAGLKEITIHEFRHSHVSLCVNEYLKSGQTDSTKFFIMMSARMGHTIDTMQETYMHLFPTIQNEIVDLLDNL